MASDGTAHIGEAGWRNPYGLAVSPGGAFGDEGGIYVALFGDARPLTENLPTSLATQVVRVDPATGEYRTFLQNRGNQPRAGRYGPGLKRVIALTFAPDAAALYVLDFGQIETTDLAPNAIPMTGTLWRIVLEGAGEGHHGSSETQQQGYIQRSTPAKRTIAVTFTTNSEPMTAFWTLGAQS